MKTKAGKRSYLLIISVIIGVLTTGCLSTSKKNKELVKSHRVVEINGVKQFLDIRGKHPYLPVLLVVHGGPGTPETSLFNYYNQELENHFIVVNWEQRGAGASLLEQVPSKESMTVDQFIQDTKAVTDLLKKEFKKKKIYILGHSWGSKLSMLTVDKYPKDYHAFIAVGMSSNVKKSEEKNFELVYKWAKEDNNTTAIEQLESISSPPFTTFDYNDPKKLGIHRLWAMYYGGGPVNLFKKDLETMMGFLQKTLSECEGYNHFNYEMTIEKFFEGEASLPIEFLIETAGINLDEKVKKVEVPVFFLHGVDDAQTNYDVAKDYFDLLSAPQKKFYTFEKSSHSPPFEEPEKFHQILIEILQATE